MKKYMVVMTDNEGNCSAAFFDKYAEAEDYMMNGEWCNYYCELYERLPADEKAPELGNEYKCIA